jgi:hypothetical protein
MPFGNIGRPTATNITQGLLGEGQASGAYNPMGNPLILRMLGQQGVRGLRNRNRRNQILQMLLGSSPIEARQALNEGERQGSSQLADLLGGAQLGEATSAQDFMRSLLGSERGYEFQAQQAQQARKEAERQRRAAAMGGLGRLAGAGATAFIPGLQPLSPFFMP